MQEPIVQTESLTGTGTAQPSRPLVVPVFLPHAGCAHRCLFCNQAVIGSAEPPPVFPPGIRNTIDSFLAHSRPRATVLIAYYGGTFLGLAEDRIRRLLELAASYVSQQQAVGIRFSTRPDTVDARRMGLIRPFPVHTVELGVQSMDDRVLNRCRRGHDAAQAVSAHRRLREEGYRTGIQLMIGLPGQDRRSVRATAEAVAALAPDFVRIYPTLVLAGSPLARLYRERRYTPLSMRAAVSLAAEMLGVLGAAGIEVARMGLQPTSELARSGNILAGPHHPSFGEQARSAAIFQETLAAISHLGPAEQVSIEVHPRLESQLRGAGNRNLRRLEERLGLCAVTVHKNAGLDRRTLRIEAGNRVKELTLFSGP